MFAARERATILQSCNPTCASWAWSVAAAGESGVRHVLAILKADMDVALGLIGRNSIADVDRSALYQSGAPVVS